MKLNRFQMWVAKVCKITPFDIEQALRDALHKGIEITEKKYAGRTMVWIDPTVRAKGYEQSAWNSEPDKHTDPYAEAHQRLQQRRTLMRHDTASLAHKVQAGNDPEFQKTQHELPRLPHNPISVTRLEPMNDWLL